MGEGVCRQQLHPLRAVQSINKDHLRMQVHHAGSMFETRKRWRVPYLIYLLAVIMLAEIAFNGELSAVSVNPVRD